MDIWFLALMFLFSQSHAVSNLLIPEDNLFQTELKSDQFCEPPDRSLIRVYGGIVNNIAANDAQERVKLYKVDWQKLLSPAPSSISILGTLILVTADHDVSLADRPPTGGWKHVKYPSSLRASMVQVGHEAHTAFLQAHANMDSIEIETANVPVYFKQIARLLVRGSERRKKEYLPIALQHIERVSNSCSELANRTAQGFKGVSALVEELLEATTETKAIRGGELEQVLTDLQTTSQEADEAEADVERYRVHAKEAEERMDESFQQLQEAIENAPGFWDFVGAGLSDAVNAVSKPFRKKKRRRKRSTGAEAAEIFAFKGCVDQVYALQKTPLNLALKLKKDTSPAKVKQEARTVKSNLKTIQISTQSYKKIPETMSSEVNRLIDEGQCICDQLVHSSKASLHKKDNTSITHLEQNCTLWATDVGALKQWVGNSFAEDPLAPITPAQTKDFDGGAVAALKATYRQNVEGQRAKLEEAQKNYDFEQQRLDDTNRKVGQLLGELAMLDFSKTDLNKTIKVLATAMTELAKLRTQWNRLQLFFIEISSIVGYKWRNLMTDFSTNVKAIVGSEGFDFGTDIIYKSAFRAAALNHRINRLASTYVKVSRDHFMGPLRDLNLLLTVDPGDEQAFKEAKDQLFVNVQRAKTDIEKAILQDRRDLMDGMASYRSKLHDEFKALCPVDNEEEQLLEKITEDAVKKGNDQEIVDMWSGF